jgi:hypothetical protein
MQKCRSVRNGAAMIYIESFDRDIFSQWVITVDLFLLYLKSQFHKN